MTMIDAILAEENNLRRFLNTRTRDKELVDDTVQDTLMKAVKNADKLDGDVGAWMRVVGVRELIKNYRKEQMHFNNANGTRAGADYDDSWTCNDADAEAYTEVFRNVREVLPKLRPVERQIVEAKLQGHSHGEIGEQTGLDRHRISRHLKAVRDIIQDAVRS